MSHDVFISYASDDKKIADAVCFRLEKSGIRCWMAPRDILPGSDWGASVVDAIKKTKVFVLVFSSYANSSPQIKREVERAVSNEVVIIPFRVEDIMPSESLEYFVSTSHWLDAITPPIEQHIDDLVYTVKQLTGNAKTVAPKRRKKRGFNKQKLKILAFAVVFLVVCFAGYTAYNAVSDLISSTFSTSTEERYSKEPLPADRSEKLLKKGMIPTDGLSLTGKIETAGSSSRYKFEAKNGEVVSIALAGTETSPSALFTPCWELLNPSGKRVGDWVRNTNQSRILKYDGTYTIRVWDEHNDGMGEYYIRLEPLSATLNGEPANVRVIACSQDHLTDTTPFRTAVNTYRFHAKAGERIAVAVQKSKTDHSALFTPCWQLLDASGKHVGDWVRNTNQERTLKKTGAYTIRVWDEHFDATGEYYIRLEPVSSTFDGNPSCAVPVQVNADPLTGSIPFKRAVNTYRFEAAAGQAVTISVLKSESTTSAVFTPCWVLLNPSGERVGRWVRNRARSLTIKDDGVHTIRVWDEHLDGLGEYRLSLK